MSNRSETLREAGSLAQPGCSMAGYLFQLVDLPGDIAVVIFGERDCANAFPRQHVAMARERQWRVYTADIREHDAVAGRAEERLLQCLRFVASDARPSAIVVLTTCLTETIGASPEPVCRQVQAETGIRIIPVHTSGLKLSTQPAISDSLAHLLVEELGIEEKPDSHAVNIVGYQTDNPPWPMRSTFRNEVAEVFGRLGLRLNAAVPLGADLREWARLSRGGLTVLPERAQFVALARLLSARGSRIEEVPPPMGIAATDKFYLRVGELVGLDGSSVLLSLPAREEAIKVMEVTAKRLAGKRIAYGIGSHHNFRADQMTFEGMAELPLLKELGFEIVLLIQERDTPNTHARIMATLKTLGISMHYKLFDEPATLAPLLAEGRYDAAILSDFLSDQASIAGVPLIPLGGPWSGYCGVKMACKEITRVLCGGFMSRYRRFL